MPFSQHKPRAQPCTQSCQMCIQILYIVLVMHTLSIILVYYPSFKILIFIFAPNTLKLIITPSVKRLPSRFVLPEDQIVHVFTRGLLFHRFKLFKISLSLLEQPPQLKPGVIINGPCKDGVCTDSTLQSLLNAFSRDFYQPKPCTHLPML